MQTLARIQLVPVRQPRMESIAVHLVRVQARQLKLIATAGTKRAVVIFEPLILTSFTEQFHEPGRQFGPGSFIFMFEEDERRTPILRSYLTDPPR